MSAENEKERYKQQAAEAAVALVQSGMVVGLGTGSTAIYATRKLGQLLHTGQLHNITCIDTSLATAAAARELQIPLLEADLPSEVDITIDGTDEFDPQLNLIKGGGGALLREKIVAQASHRVIIVADESKRSTMLGALRALPVEVLPFGWRSQQRFLEALGARVQLRQQGSETYHTEHGNLVLDCHFGPIHDLAQLAAQLGQRAGVVAHGLFLGIATDLMVAGARGVEHMARAR